MLVQIHETQTNSVRQPVIQYFNVSEKLLLKSDIADRFCNISPLLFTVCFEAIAVFTRINFSSSFR